jgi:hypothetical protein
MPSDVAVPVPVVAAGVLSGATEESEPKSQSVTIDAALAEVPATIAAASRTLLSCSHTLVSFL